MSTKFFYFVCRFLHYCIGDLFYITPLYSNRQHVFLKKYKKGVFLLKYAFFTIEHSIHLLFFYNR
ncbi:hypothetical protein COF61_00730 [Bacillus toyonensis]|nr:hypothetical protein COF61_00730 [Bacillus toyonensis]